MHCRSTQAAKCVRRGGHSPPPAKFLDAQPSVRLAGADSSERGSVPACGTAPQPKRNRNVRSRFLGSQLPSSAEFGLTTEPTPLDALAPPAGLGDQLG